MTVSADTIRFAQVALAAGVSTIPASPQWVQASITKESVKFNPAVSVSNTLDPSGQPRDSVLTGGTCGGAVDFELAKSLWFESTLAAVFRNAWGQNLPVGYTPPGGASSSNVLIPHKTQTRFAIEKTWTMAPGAPDPFLFHRFLPLMYGSASLSIIPNQSITGSFGVVGGAMELGNAIVSGATYPAATVGPTFTAPKVTELTLGTYDVSTFCFSKCDLTFNSNVRGIACIGTLGEKEQALGRFETTIASTVYFASNVMLQHLQDQDTFAGALKVTDALTGTYEFIFPKLKITDAQVLAQGTNTDVVVDMSLQALYDSTAGYSVAVIRDSAAA